MQLTTLHLIYSIPDTGLQFTPALLSVIALTLLTGCAAILTVTAPAWRKLGSAGHRLSTKPTNNAWQTEVQLLNSKLNTLYAYVVQLEAEFNEHKAPNNQLPCEQALQPTIAYQDDAAAEALRDQGYYDGPWNSDRSLQASALTSSDNKESAGSDTETDTQYPPVSDDTAFLTILEKR